MMLKMTKFQNSIILYGTQGKKIAHWYGPFLIASDVDKEKNVQVRQSLTGNKRSRQLRNLHKGKLVQKSFHIQAFVIVYLF